MHEGFVYFEPHLPSLVYYGSFFVFGCLFHRQRGFLQALTRKVGLWAVLAALMFPLSLWASRLDHAAQGASVALHLGAVLANGLCTWALIYLMLGCALRYFDRESPWIQYLSQSSYWVYLVQKTWISGFLHGRRFDLKWPWRESEAFAPRRVA